MKRCSTRAEWVMAGHEICKRARIQGGRLPAPSSFRGSLRSSSVLDPFDPKTTTGAASPSLRQCNNKPNIQDKDSDRPSAPSQKTGNTPNASSDPSMQDSSSVQEGSLDDPDIPCSSSSQDDSHSLTVPPEDGNSSSSNHQRSMISVRPNRRRRLYPSRTSRRRAQEETLAWTIPAGAYFGLAQGTCNPTLLLEGHSEEALRSVQTHRLVECAPVQAAAGRWTARMVDSTGRPCHLGVLRERPSDWRGRRWTLRHESCNSQGLSRRNANVSVVQQHHHDQAQQQRSSNTATATPTWGVLTVLSFAGFTSREEAHQQSPVLMQQLHQALQQSKSNMTQGALPNLLPLQPSAWISGGATLLGNVGSYQVLACRDAATDSIVAMDVVFVDPTRLSETTTSTDASSTLPLTQKHLQLHNHRLSTMSAQEENDNDDTSSSSCASAAASLPGTVSDTPCLKEPFHREEKVATSPSVPLSSTAVPAKPVVVQNTQSQRLASNMVSQGSRNAPPLSSSLSRRVTTVPLAPTLHLDAPLVTATNKKADRRTRTTPGLPRLDHYAEQQQTPTVWPMHAALPLDPKQQNQPTDAVYECSHAKDSASSSTSRGQKARLSFSSAPSRHSLYESAVADHAVVDSQMGAFRSVGADEQVKSASPNRVQGHDAPGGRVRVSTLFQDFFFGVHDDECPVDIWQPTTDTILHHQALLSLEEDEEEQSDSACWTEWLVSCLLLVLFVPWLFAVHTWLSQQVVVVDGSMDASLPMDEFPLGVDATS